MCNNSLPLAIEKAIDSLWYKLNEELVILDESGTELHRIQGERDRVSIPKPLVGTLANTVMIHNHPGAWDEILAQSSVTASTGVDKQADAINELLVQPNHALFDGPSFNAKDISVGLPENPKQLIVVGPRMVYTMNRPESGWPDSVAMSTMLESLIQQQHPISYDPHHRACETMCHHFSIDYDRRAHKRQVTLK